MNIDSVIGKLVRYFNREMLDFSGSPGYTPLPAPESDRSYLLYLHVPYCHVLCPFCSFHRVRFKQGPASRYMGHLKDECEFVADRGYVFDEIYFGGGTPTVIPDLLFDMIETLKARHPIRSVSIETNPDDLAKAIDDPELPEDRPPVRRCTKFRRCVAQGDAAL